MTQQRATATCWKPRGRVVRCTFWISLLAAVAAASIYGLSFHAWYMYRVVQGRVDWSLTVMNGRLSTGVPLFSMYPDPAYGQSDSVPPRITHTITRRAKGRMLDSPFDVPRIKRFSLPLWIPPAALLLPVFLTRPRRIRPGHCPCGYELAGNTSGTCPECGYATFGVNESAITRTPSKNVHPTAPMESDS